MTSPQKPDSSPSTNVITRDLSPVAGSDNPRQPGNPFYLDNGVEMFEIRLDATNVVGPRPATLRDKTDHADAYAIFKASVLEQTLAQKPTQGSIGDANPKRRGRPPKAR